MAARPPKIVVIDDNEVVLEVAKEALEDAGYEVVTHDRATGCVALVLHEQPDVVLMDVNMPGLGGDTVVGVLAKAWPGSDHVILLHSSLSADALRSKVAASGANGFVQKSSDPQGLVREVNKWLRRSGDFFAAAPHRSSAGFRVPQASQPRVIEQVSVPPFASAPPSSGTVSTGTQSSDSNSSIAVAGNASSAGAGSDSRGSGARRILPGKLLLVDDDITVLSGLRRCLQSEPLSIEFALSGGEALRRMLSDAPPDVVVCDMLLPDLTGMEVYEKAMSSEPSYRRRFIAATGGAAVPRVAAFLRSFGGPVLHKPIETTPLLNAVRACLANYPARVARG